MHGGIATGHRDLFTEGDYGAFEQLVERVLGIALRADKGLADQLWGALANVTWYGPKGEQVSYSFRAAGDILAAVRRDTGRMTYMKYYCSVPDRCVPDWAALVFGEYGWRFEVDP